MRLAQLARKVGKNQSDIVKFLGEKGVTIEEASNTKVDDMLATLVIENFAPELMDAKQFELQEEDGPQLTNEPEVIKQIASEIEGEKLENELAITSVAQDVVQEESVEKIEVIKVPKIELQGLKVLGKIDLPPTKVKASEKEPPSKTYGKVSQNEFRRHQPSEPRKNPIALQREREDEEKERKKLEKAAYLKEIKTQRYLNKVRRPIDVFKEPISATSAEVEPKRKPMVSKSPKESFLSRLIKWLTFNK